MRARGDDDGGSGGGKCRGSGVESSDGGGDGDSGGGNGKRSGDDASRRALWFRTAWCWGVSERTNE